MRKFFTLLIILASQLPSIAQTTTSQQGSIGQVVTRPYQHKLFTDIDGTPFLFDDFYHGYIHLIGGGNLEKVTINYDALEDNIVFRQDNQTFDLPSGAQYFVVKPATPGMKDSMLFRCGYPDVDDNTGNTFYEVLADGDVSLLKCYRKVTTLSKENALVSNKREFSVDERYYLGESGKPPIKIKRDQKSLLNALSDKKDMLEPFIKSQKINCRTEGGMIAVINKYNER